MGVLSIELNSSKAVYKLMNSHNSLFLRVTQLSNSINLIIAHNLPRAIPQPTHTANNIMSNKWEVNMANKFTGQNDEQKG